MWQLIQEQGIPPLRTLRYCCRVLKEAGGKDRTVIVGIRKAESNNRKKRKEYERVTKKKIMISPILEWSNEQVWAYIHNNNLPYPILYDQGFKRIGCIMCPCAGGKKMKEEARRYPKIAAAYRRACIKAFDHEICTTWKNGNEMYEWWISGKSFTQNEGQEELEW